MASVTIRNLDDDLKRRLRIRAAEHGRSMEEEVRHILRAALSESSREPQNLAEAVRRRFAALGGVELDVPPRDPMRAPPRIRPMIILETNVLSELMRPSPSEKVVVWISGQPQQSFFTTTVTEAEIRYGLALISAGARRDGLESAAEGLFSEDLAGRILPF